MWPIRFASILGVAILVASQECKTFQDHNYYYRPTTYTCSSECMKRGPEDAKVYGTLLYHKSSDICLASLHAGALNMSGGEVKIERKRYESFESRITGFRRGRSLHGTCRNRVCSDTITSSGNLFEVSETAKVISNYVSGDVMLIHNNFLNGTLKLLCLTEDPETHYTKSNLMRWNFADLGLGTVIGPSKVFAEATTGGNRHVLHCKGRSVASDVLALFTYENAPFKSASHTWRCSNGEDLEISITTGDGQVDSSLKRLPVPAWNADDLSFASNHPYSYKLKIKDMKPEDSGLHYLGPRRNECCLNIIVRDCPAGKFGPKCDNRCPNCQNGGQCHSYTGECLCPPGFIGKECQHACPKGWFGTKCQFHCDKKYLENIGLFPDSCKGLILCLPSPMGCSCFPGYKSPMCNEECSTGTFGAECTESCSEKCGSERCDTHTGSCFESDSDDLSIRPPTQVSMSDDLLLSWRDDYYKQQHRYFVTTNVTNSCQEDRIGDAELRIIDDGNLQTTFSEESLKDSEIDVCVTASDSLEGNSKASCISLSALPKKTTVTFDSELACANYETSSLRCTAEIQNRCPSIFDGNYELKFNLSSFLACNQTAISRSESETLPISGKSSEHIFRNLIPGLQYDVNVSVIYNGVVISESLGISAKLDTDVPPTVEDLTVAILGEDKVRLMWNDPCPPNGEISGYYIRHSWSRPTSYIPKSDTHCPKTIKYDGCYNISSLTKRKMYEGRYTYVRIYNSDGKYRDSEYYKFLMAETEPSTPEILLPEDQGSPVTILPPTQPGGDLVNCTFTVGKESCVKPYTEDEFMTCQMADLPPGKIIEVRAWCCNTKFCGSKSTKELVTKPSPEFEGSLTVGEKTNSSVAISLPWVTNEGDGNSSFLIVVEHVTQDGEGVEDLQGKVEALLTRDRKGRKEKINCLDGTFWIAGEISSSTIAFVVGDGKDYNGYYNCPLQEGEAYRFAVRAATRLRDKETIIWKKFVPSTQPVNVLTIIIITVALILLFLLIGVYTYRKRGKLVHSRPIALEVPRRQETTQQTAQSDVTENPNFHLAVKKDISLILGASYPNVDEDENIYANIFRRISPSDTENYLHVVINDKKTLGEFESIPESLRDITVGALPVNEKKNRYRNNLPYDETRVKLSIINNDPSSDYINANYIQGYSSIKYIATQGPKDQSEPTIRDFWRMILEQQVTAIIMVANFEEGGKVKVGKYMSHEETLVFENYAIQVTSSKQEPYFTVSTIQVFVDTIPRHTVTHYHYTNWPDHGVPEEAISISYLVTNFLDNHDNGGVVVHSSAGIGRTGTMLMVLLLQEMLKIQDSIDPVEVLAKLRSGRGRLVENIEQYNLALEITDEVFFGNVTKITSTNLQKRLEHFLTNSFFEYEKIKAFPTPSPYEYSSSEAFRHLNRNPNILPRDSHRIYLQMVNGEEESQYINAVHIHGFSKSDRFLVTEHPLRQTQAKFWRMIMEMKCPSVVLINHYPNHDKEEFPPLLPEENQEMNVSGYKITLDYPFPSGPDLMQYNLTVRNPCGQQHTLTAYVVLNWEYGHATPKCPNGLLNLADKLLHSVTQLGSGPPLLCCGDGVTGCGLLAGLMLIIQRAQIEQVFDIYRAVVKLLKCRHQFITCEQQYAMLYLASSIYLRDFPIYVKF
ncbi:receptor-type tyrosine-protein phosphatase C-like isoform X1 [Palaemon carinicauda]|uniref:receptor-type tyrosine-protein phosphatase C-like isoform X1 n=1 Tax=Palaemon carinicauda TaxID=392227 RepID=UPI0035B66F65